jgi:histidine triad (HIT) family protein
MTPKQADCLFCKIVSGEVGTELIYSDDHCLAFLDHRPVFKGHTLLVPRCHFPTFADVPPEELPYLMKSAQRLTIAVENGLEADGSFVAMNNRISQSVPHLHIHIVPRRKGDGLRGFFWPRTKYTTPEEAQEYAAKILAALPDSP